MWQIFQRDVPFFILKSNPAQLILWVVGFRKIKRQPRIMQINIPVGWLFTSVVCSEPLKENEARTFLHGNRILGYETINLAKHTPGPRAWCKIPSRTAGSATYYQLTGKQRQDPPPQLSALKPDTYGARFSQVSSHAFGAVVWLQFYTDYFLGTPGLPTQEASYWIKRNYA